MVFFFFLLLEFLCTFFFFCYTNIFTIFFFVCYCKYNTHEIKLKQNLMANNKYLDDNFNSISLEMLILYFNCLLFTFTYDCTLFNFLFIILVLIVYNNFLYLYFFIH